MNRETRDMGRASGAIFLGILIGFSSARGQAPAAAPVAPSDFSDIESFLNQVEAERKKSLFSETDLLARQWNGYLASDAALVAAYKDAYEAVHFEGAKKEHANVKAWEDKNKALFRDDDFLAAMRLHVRYLVISLVKRSGDDEAAMKMIMEWMNSFPKDGDRFRKVSGQEILKKGLAESPFVKTSAAPRFVLGIPSWHAGDLGNLGEIHRVNVIGWLRSKSDPRLLAEWDTNLRMEEELAIREGLAARREEFGRNRRPWLMLQAGKDLVFVGQRRQGVDLMVRALRESPRSAYYDAIVAEVRRVIAEARQPAKP
jgi:hypothetical protein